MLHAMSTISIALGQEVCCYRLAVEIEMKFCGMLGRLVSHFCFRNSQRS